MTAAASPTAASRAPAEGIANGTDDAPRASHKPESAALQFARQAEKLSLHPTSSGSAGGSNDSLNALRSTAVGARFITPRDPVIETASGDRLPAVPLVEAQKLNQLKNEIRGANDAASKGNVARRDQNGGDESQDVKVAKDVSANNVSGDAAAVQPDGAAGSSVQKEHERRNEAKASEVHRHDRAEQHRLSQAGDADADPEASGEVDETNQAFERMAAPLTKASPPSQTNPLFPPLPLYGPPSLLRSLQCRFLRFTSFWLSLGFLWTIVLGSAVTSIPLMFQHIWIRLKLQDPDARRPFNQEEKTRRAARKQSEANWTKHKRRRASFDYDEKNPEELIADDEDEFVPTEGGADPLVADASYYARRVGLDMEEYKVQTEDGFIIRLWHVYNPKEYVPASDEERQQHKPEVFPEETVTEPDASPCGRRRRSKAPTRYPVLLIPGLLQAAGSYCANDDESLAFYLAKCGYDVWLGNNRCGFKPEHTLLHYGDPRLWCFNIRQMGVLDLPALVSRVLTETGFPKLGLVCHSQGTTETFVALAKDQRPDLGQRISVFCALAPAVYAGPLIGKMYFKFMKIISPSMFRIFFGIHAFIPFMMTMHTYLPGLLYGAMGYRVFSFLFDWTDQRWERDLRDRQFQFAPVYVSSESMRWWLGRECFAKHKCVLATREEGEQEAAEDDSNPPDSDVSPTEHRRRAWYDDQAPPMALWVAGSDQLVDGRRLIRRFEHGREPDVKLVHAKVIEEYEHLDVLWAMDAMDKVGREVKEVIWRTAVHQDGCAVPKGCADLKPCT